MKILLIAPSTGRWHHVGRRRMFSGRTFRFSQLSLLRVAAETPEGIDVELIDEQLDTIPPGINADLVGITCMTALAPRAYHIADAFRARGIPVVLGGIHPTLNPDEASAHADAVVIGDAEGLWADVVDDARRGQLQPLYRHKAPPSLSRMKATPHHLIDRRRYAPVHAVQATRGCPHTCRFCAVSAFHGGSQRRRPVEDVVREVAAQPGRTFIFVDDNLTADRHYTELLLRALAPLGKRWITQSTLAFAEDPAMVALAARAGCVGLFVGIETFSHTNLDTVGKDCNRVEQYRDSIQRLHRHGIAVEAGIVLGFDGDDAGVFRRTLRLLDDLEVDVIQASILTPLPGTPAFDSMASRLHHRDWECYDFHHVVFEPARMTAAELKSGHDWLTWTFYQPWRVARRLWRHARRPGGLRTLPHLAAINLAYYGRTRSWGIRGRDPGVAPHAAAAAAQHGAVALPL